MQYLDTKRQIETIRKRTCLLPVMSICLLISSGLRAQTTTKIGIDQLPEASKTELDKKYSKFQVNSMVKKESEQMRPTYEFELQTKNKLVYLVYDTTGTLLSKSKSKTFSFDGTEPVKKSSHGSNGGHNHMH